VSQLDAETRVHFTLARIIRDNDKYNKIATGKEEKKESLVQIHTSLEWGLLRYVTRCFEFETSQRLGKMG
jgi:hypothetical protein